MNTHVLSELDLREPSLEVLIRATQRLTLRSYRAILSEVQLSLEEVDHIANPYRLPRLDWGIRDLSTRKQDVRVVLAPAKLPARRPAGLTAPTSGLVAGINDLQEAAAIPRNFSARTVERVQRMGAGIGTGDVTAVELVSVNGMRQAAVVDEQVISRAKEAVRPVTRSWGSVVGTLAVLDKKNPKQPRAEISVPGHGATLVLAQPEHADQLKNLWGQRVLAAGLLTRNSTGQAVRLSLESLDGLPSDETRLTAWDILGIAPRATGDMTTAEYLESIRGR